MKYWQYLEEAAKINKNNNVNKLILVHLLKKELTWLYANLQTEDKKGILENYLALVNKYVEGYPLAYIIGYVMFRGYKFIVNKNVLIPRDETLYLIERTLQLSEKYFDHKKLKMLDLATGSGIIGITLAFNHDYNIVATDVSVDALKIAQRNIKYHNLKNIKLIKSDLFDNLHGQKFDVIISNPPYIDKNSLSYDKKQLRFEPSLALFAENKGLFFYEAILKDVLKYVNGRFIIALEFGWDQKSALENLIQAYLTKNVTYQFEKDINKKWRYLFIKNL